MDKQTRELRDQLRAKYGPEIVYADVKRLGLVAVKRPATEDFNEYLAAVFSPLESTGVAKEGMLVDAMIWPEDAKEKERAKRFLKSMPVLVNGLAVGVEAMCAGEYTDYKPEADVATKLDELHEFGWDGIVPVGFQPIVLATSETAGTVARRTIEAAQNGSPQLAGLIRTAVLAFVKSPEVAAVEAILDERPGLLIPLWVRCQDLAGAGVSELGKG
jgi:hypothetical protein